MTGKRLPPEVLEYFREQGSRGGKVGGKVAASKMTPEERAERARKAAAAATAARQAKAAAKRAAAAKKSPATRKRPA